jgi:hypothetical protein
MRKIWCNFHVWFPRKFINHRHPFPPHTRHQKPNNVPYANTGLLIQHIHYLDILAVMPEDLHALSKNIIFSLCNDRNNISVFRAICRTCSSFWAISFKVSRLPAPPAYNISLHRVLFLLVCNYQCRVLRCRILSTTQPSFL